MIFILQNMFFDGWGKIGRSLLLAVLAYVALVVMLRITGKRTLSKMNVFDFVFVVALGSTLASTILSPGVTLADGLGAFAALIALQILLSRLCASSHRVDHFINGEPTLILYRGSFLEETLKRERVTKEEVRAAVRNTGHSSTDKIDSVVLEPDGSFSVVPRREEENYSGMIDVEGHPARLSDDKLEAVAH